MEEQRAELIHYLRIVWRQKWVIAVTFIAAIIAAWGASSSIQAFYRAEASLLLLPPFASELAAESEGSILKPNAYRLYAESTSVLLSVRERSGLPDNTELEVLQERLSVALDPLLISGDRYDQSGQVVLKFSATWPNPETAASIVSNWIQVFREGFRTLFTERTSLSIDYFSETLLQTELALSEVVEERNRLLTESPLDVMRSEVAVLLEMFSADLLRRLEVQRSLESSRAQLDELEGELSKREPSYRMRQTLDPDSLAVGLLAGLSTRDAEALTSTEGFGEVVNDTYVRLDELVATTRASIRAFEAELAHLAASIPEIDAQLAKKQSAILVSEAALEQLDDRIEVLRSNRTKLSSKLTDAQIALADTLSPTRILDEPIAPSEPSNSTGRTSVAIAGFLGLLFGTLLAFLLDYLTGMRGQETSASLAMKQATERSPDPEEGALQAASKTDDATDSHNE